ncbi:MAG: 4Fe-4S dicluster domain-containing protein [Nitrospirae bacterium]|nr:4Fe-4S dicluster domain-containing protein [Nitrospirota bacterium]
MIYATGIHTLKRYASLDEVIDQAAQWLAAGRIGMVVGYGRQSPFTDLTMPTFVVSREQLEQELVWNPFCDYNLLNYANLGARQAARGKGGVAIVVKPCELHNLDILMEEGNMSGVTRDNVLPVVMQCSGVYETDGLNAYTKEVARPFVQTKCLDCPEYLAAHGAAKVAEDKLAHPRYLDYEANKADDSEINWAATLNKCLHCYACRNVCPSCYCTQGCPADEASTTHITNALRMVKHIDTSRQVVYNLVRTWHIQARCSECLECERVCPVDIPIMALKSKLGREFAGEGSPGDVMGFLVNFAGRIMAENAEKERGGD